MLDQPASVPVQRTFRERVLARETLLGTFVGLGSPMVAELCGRAGLDWVVIDLEHGSTGEAQLLPMILAALAGGATPLVRVEQADRIRIGRALDAGAAGVVVPRLETVEQAHQVVSWLRFPPAGVRGVALATRGLDYGAAGHEAVALRHTSIAGIVQVENAAMVVAAPEIAAIDGIDALFVGPADLSHALGVPGRLEEPVYRDAIVRIGRAAADQGKAAGVLVWRPEDVAHYLPFGFTFFSVSADGPIFLQALLAALAATRERLVR